MALTATPRTGFGRFTFPPAKTANLLFRSSLSETGSADATVHIDPSTRTVSGSVSPATSAARRAQLPLLGRRAETLEDAAADCGLYQLGTDIIQLAELELADPAVPTPVPQDGTAKGWMRDRYADGHWAEGFSPSTEAGFVEGSSAKYTWMVYSDVVALAQAMGGAKVAVDRLDAFFRNPDGTFDLVYTLGTAPSLTWGSGSGDVPPQN